MHSQTLARSLAAGAVIVAGGLVLLVQAPIDVDAPPAVAVDARPAPPEVMPAVDAEPGPAAAFRETPAAAKERELEAMSETYRNTTFLIAIREAGFDCNELLRVSGGLDGSAKWLVTCGEMLAYTVAVASDGTLRIEPFLQYSDGLGVRIIELELDPSQQQLQPQLQPQPQPLPAPR